MAEIAARYAVERKARGVTNEDQLAAQRLLARYDKNKNRAVDIFEVDDKPPAQGAEGAVQVAAETFVDFDSNVDQKLEIRELEIYLASRRKKDSK